MGRSKKSEVTESSRAIIDTCRDLLGESGMSALEFFEKSGITSNYWYTRMRYEAPFNTSDIDNIASALGLEPIDIYKQASARTRIDVSQLSTDVRKKMALRNLDLGGIGTAALEDENKAALLERGEIDEP